VCWLRASASSKQQKRAFYTAMLRGSYAGRYSGTVERRLVLQPREGRHLRMRLGEWGCCRLRADGGAIHTTRTSRPG
jgi:hypothetical protein